MSRSDQWVVIVIGLLMVLHLAVLSIGYFTGRFAGLAALLNAAGGSAIILYWVIREMQVRQHYVETRELMALAAELCVVLAAVFFIRNDQRHDWLRSLQYIFFWIHFALLAVGLIFVFTFKMKLF